MRMHWNQGKSFIDLDICEQTYLPVTMNKEQTISIKYGLKDCVPARESSLTGLASKGPTMNFDEFEKNRGRAFQESKLRRINMQSDHYSAGVEDLNIKAQQDIGIVRDPKQMFSSNPEDNESSAADITECGNSTKDAQTTSTLQWLTENYELCDGVCLPRCVLYLHYLDLCKRQGFKPAGAATFGKLIRQKFKNITTRRLGTRGQSKYHYYGIGIKESSVYYQSVYTGKGLTRFSGIKIKTEGSNRKYSLSSKTGTLLPDFPDASNFVLPSKEITDQMNTFLMMYRTHCQRILDTIITANFEEIQNLFLHFWQGYPAHLEGVLKLDITADVIAVCDSILYKVLQDVLLPHSIQDLPEGLCGDVRAFLKALPGWLDNSLEDLVPESIKKVKRTVLRHFLRSMTRHLSFIKMAQTARPQLVAVDVTNKALNDLHLVDIQPISTQACFALNERAGQTKSHSVSKVFKDLKSLLRAQTPIDGYTEYIDGLVESCVLQPSNSQPWKPSERAGRFLMQWTMFGTLIMKDLTLNNAKSFSFLHLLKLTLDEYVLLVLETRADRDRQAKIQANLQARMKNTEEINMNAKVRSKDRKTQMALKTSRKRKVTATGGSEEGTVHMETSSFLQSNYDNTNSEELLCSQAQQPMRLEGEELNTNPSHLIPQYPPNGTAQCTLAGGDSLSCRSLENNSADDTPLTASFSSPVHLTESVATKSPMTTNNPPSFLPTLSPITKSFSSGYERGGPYIPSFHLNTAYSDYINHSHGSASLSQTPYSAIDHASQQHYSFHHPISYNASAVNSAPPAPPPYWANTYRSEPISGDLPYHHHLSYANRNLSQTYDIYKREGIHLSYYDTSLHNRGFIARPTPSYDYNDRSTAMQYHSRQHDSFPPSSSLSGVGVSSYNGAFVHDQLHQLQAPPTSHPQPSVSCHFARQDHASSFRLHDDSFAPSLGANSGLASLRKSYLPASFI